MQPATYEIVLNSTSREQLIDITDRIRQALRASGMRQGICHLFCRHTTAGLTVNENSDPDVCRDLLAALSRIVREDWDYRHAEGNSPAHVKSTLLGCQLALPVRGGELALGRWQGVLFAEFDGPRQGRQILLTLLETADCHPQAE